MFGVSARILIFVLEHAEEIAGRQNHFRLRAQGFHQPSGHATSGSE